MKNLFDMTGKTALITGGGGILGPKHAEAIVDYGGEVVLADHNLEKAAEKAELINHNYGRKVARELYIDVTDKESVEKAASDLSQVDILINNAAKDPKVENSTLCPTSRFETMTPEYWKEGLDAIVNGTFFCSQVFGNKMLEQGGGVILNISSCLGVIAPDQRIYLQEGLEEDQQNVKPITYSAAKWAVVGMTKYLSVYFADKNIRVNCLSPTGVYNTAMPDEFVKKLSKLIPMGRMANIEDYKGAIVFLCSDASSYMTGENLIVDGGKTVW
tara:strand:+ start:44216 stop:45031 length:816 start_codon:yes stop_codon:yes gene_type:complete